MGSTLVVAEKEFKDLLSDRIIMVVVAAFLLYILVDLYQINNQLGQGFFDIDPNINQNNPAANLAETMLNQITFMLSRYGAILGIAIGFLSIAGERHSGALNTLVSKPLHRYAIITGKTIGAMGFLICVFALAAALLTAGLMILASHNITPVIGEYISRAPLAILTALLYTMVFFFLAMLISLLIESYAFALILSLLTWTVSGLMTNVAFSGYFAIFLAPIIGNGTRIGNLLASLSPDAARLVGDQTSIGSLIVGLSPDGMIKNISYYGLTNFDMDLGGCIGRVEIDVLKLAIYAIILLALSFVAFHRRDIA